MVITNISPAQMDVLVKLNDGWELFRRRSLSRSGHVVRLSAGSWEEGYVEIASVKARTVELLLNAQYLTRTPGAPYYLCLSDKGRAAVGVPGCANWTELNDDELDALQAYYGAQASINRNAYFIWDDLAPTPVETTMETYVRVERMAGFVGGNEPATASFSGNGWHGEIKPDANYPSNAWLHDRVLLYRTTGRIMGQKGK